MDKQRSLSSGAVWRILRLSALFTAIACVIVSTTIMIVYDRSDWPFELMISNVLTIGIAFSMTFLIGSKMEQIKSLTDALRDVVERDRLTDVATRDFFFQRLEGEQDTYGVSLMIDIDHFKQVNDDHGHMIGDEVIKMVASVLKTEVGERDVVCRFGGEEFVVFLEKATESGGWKIAERMRRSIELQITPAASGDVRVTISVGGSMKSQVEHIDEAIQRADACLYRAKNLGRNRTIVDWEGDPVRSVA